MVSLILQPIGWRCNALDFRLTKPICKFDKRIRIGWRFNALEFGLTKPICKFDKRLGDEP